MPAPGALTPRNRVLLVVLLLVLLGVSVHRLYCAGPAGPYVVLSGRTMGTSYNVKVADEDIDADAMRSLGALIEARLERVNALMSTWDPESEISRFNASRSTGPFPISPETLQVIETAALVHADSAGAFDITVGPLVEAWGFGPTDRPLAPPSEAELARLDGLIGQEKLRLDARAGTLSKTHPEIEIDLSAVAKGYGVDAVALALEERGHHDYLVEIGGELRAAGKRTDGRTWRLAIERPDAAVRAVHEVLPLSDLAMATSGDYRNYYEEEGVRISHTIDPRTRSPIRHRLASVTVIAPEAAVADAWATALNVLGPEAGYALAEQRGMAAYFLERLEDGDFRASATRGFEALRATRGDAADLAAPQTP